MHHDEEVRKIAYHLWEKEGHLHGQDLDHWLKAEVIWSEQQEEKVLPGEPMPQEKASERKRVARTAAKRTPRLKKTT
jgi:hypothetical protein